MTRLILFETKRIMRHVLKKTERSQMNNEGLNHLLQINEQIQTQIKINHHLLKMIELLERRIELNEKQIELTEGKINVTNYENETKN